MNGWMNLTTCTTNRSGAAIVNIKSGRVCYEIDGIYLADLSWLTRLTYCLTITHCRLFVSSIHLVILV